jgi:hypothetical protein
LLLPSAEPRAGGKSGRAAEAARALAVVAGAAVLLWPAVLNGFPLVFDDTGTYIASGFHPQVPLDRPATYGLFLRVTSLGGQLWFSICAQALLVVWALQRAFTLATGRRSWAAPIALAVAAGCLGGAAIAASELMPDVFTALVLVSIAALLVLPMGHRDLIAFGALLALGLVVHLSHLNVALALLALAAAWNLFARGARFRVTPRRWALVAGITAASWLAIPSTHALLGGGFTLVRGGPVFLVGRIAENGILGDVLRARCPTAGWRLCAYQDRFPMTTNDFAWSNASPLYLTGGWTDENMGEFRDILRASLGTPAWVARHAREAAVASAKQLALASPTRWIGPLRDESFWVVIQLRRWLPERYPAYDRAAQHRGTLRLRWLDSLQWVAVAASVLALVGAAASRPTRERAGIAWPFAVLLVAGTIANAVVCASLSNPQDRYQYRVVYLAGIAAITVWAAARAHRRPATESARLAAAPADAPGGECAGGRG